MYFSSAKPAAEVLMGTLGFFILILPSMMGENSSA
jgi:hypothetical protein